MMNSKVIAAAVVVVVAVVVVACAAVLLSGNGNSGKEYGDSTNVEGRLTIFGNANHDDYIDERDVETIQSIIDGKTTPEYFDCVLTYGGNTVQRCFADANCDGKVDLADLNQVKDMVDRKNGIQVKYYDCDGVVAACTYPIGNNLCITYKAFYEASSILGIEDKVLYACNQVADGGAYAQWYPAIAKNAKSVGDRFHPDYEVFTKSGNTIPDCFITGQRQWYDPDMEEKLARLGIDVVRLPLQHTDACTKGVLTLGWLLGCEEKAYAYMDMVDQVFNTIDEKIKDIPMSQRPFVYASYNGTTIANGTSGVHEAITLAGARSALDMGYIGGTKIDAEAVHDMGADWICFSEYYGFLETYTNHDETQKKLYEEFWNTEGKYAKFIEMTDAYKNGKVMGFNQGTFMGAASFITVAYVANHIYPDLFNFDVDKLFQDYLDTFHNGRTVSEFQGINYFMLEDVQKYFS
ncbi:MAG: ABC transporter substrate-binding protein [Candidatus Methanomethylophilaceae archaeon]|nr:ABC transporter substrate-binding protein [Candidatus Methanomethylophilaceae archaeon]